MLITDGTTPIGLTLRPVLEALIVRGSSHEVVQP